MAVPKLVVFDCDMCLWSPEMFQLDAPPSTLDKATNSVVAGRDRVSLFPGALHALRELHKEERFRGTKVAVASSTTQTAWARQCLRLLEISPGVAVDSVLDFREIYPSNKARHFKSLREGSNVEYHEMLFFDDCNWGDNCRDVRRACPGVSTVKTPDGLTEAKWLEGLAEFARSKERA